MTTNSHNIQTKTKVLSGFLLILILVALSSCLLKQGQEEQPLPNVITTKDIRFILKIKANNREKKLIDNTLKLGALEDDLVFELVPEQNPKQTDSLHVHRFHNTSRDSVFAFQLKGLDAGLVKTPYPTIRYTNLIGGKYVFVYSFRANDSVILNQQYILVDIQKTMGESSWFYPVSFFFLFVLIIVIVYFWTVYEFRQKIKVATIRNRIAGDLHDEIGSDLGSVVLSLKAVQNKYAKDVPQLNDTLEEVKKEIKETSATLRDSVWLIQPKNDSFEKLFDKIYNFAQRVLKAEQIELVYNNHLEGQKDWKISMERRRNVYLIIREAIHNIIKHAQATQVQIAINREEEGVRVVIVDNGIGFKEDEIEESGNGLLNFKQRATESYIEFDLKSTPSVGTTISMFIPEF